MTKSIRFVLLLSACALALAFGGNALAAYNPSLLVAGTSHSTGSGGPIVIGVGQDQADDATGVLNIYAPLGYGVTLTQAPNTRIGDLEGIVLVRALANARVPIQGTVTARDPGAYTNPAQFPCGQGIRHEAVWVIQTTLAGNPLEIPIYVDRVTSGAEAQFASAKMRICLASPYVAPPQGAAAGASLIVAAFSVSGVFSNPNTRGTYPWNALFIPYAPGTATLNPANAAQSTSFTRLPVQLAVTAKKLKARKGAKRKFARVTTCLSEAGQPVRGVRVNILAGRTASDEPRRLRPHELARLSDADDPAPLPDDVHPGVIDGARARRHERTGLHTAALRGTRHAPARALHLGDAGSRAEPVQPNHRTSPPLERTQPERAPTGALSLFWPHGRTDPGRHLPWADEALSKHFYPPGLKAGERLVYYAEHFDTVEPTRRTTGFPWSRWPPAGPSRRPTTSSCM